MSLVQDIPIRPLSLGAPCELGVVREVCGRIRQFLAGCGMDAKELGELELALTEAGNNAVLYAKPEGRKLPVRYDVDVRGHHVEVRLFDHTPGFEFPERAELPDPEAESGRGLFLIQSLTDEAIYLRGRGENCLVLRKNWDFSPAVAAREEPKGSEVDRSQNVEDPARTLELMTEELASSFESLSAIFRFSAEVSASGNSPEFTRRWLNELLLITESDWFVLRLVDPRASMLRDVMHSFPDGAGAPTPLEPLFLTPTWRSSLPIELKAAIGRNDVPFDPGAPLGFQDPLAACGVAGTGFAHPMVVNDSLVGVLTVGRRDGTRAFQSGHASVIQTFADFFAIQTRSQQMQEERVQSMLTLRDLEIAATIQRSLLPEKLPSAPGIDLAGFYRSARVIGGDYYDVIPVEGGALLLVADVMGKGLPAALFAMMFRSLVRARTDLASRPGEFLAWLNTNLFRELDRAGMFITAQLAFCDVGRKEIRVAGAGHPPLLLAGDQGDVRETASGGPPIGILEASAFPEDVVVWKNSRLLMFTDGLIEARDPVGGLLGLEAAKGELAAAARGGLSGGETRDALSSLLVRFEKGTAPADDTAFIVMVTTHE